MKCPICNYYRAVEITRRCVEETVYIVYQCMVCDHGYIEPIPTVELLSKIASKDYGLRKSGSSINVDAVKSQYVRIFSRRVNPNYPDNERKLLSISDGRGIFESVAEEFGWKTDTITFKDFMNFINIPTTESPINSTESDYNLIVLDNVFEHFFDPVQAVYTISKWLSKDGGILLIVPNMESKSFKSQGKNWKYLSIPFHINYFNRLGMDLIFLKKLNNPNLHFKKIFQTTFTWDEGAGDHITALYKKAS